MFEVIGTFFLCLIVYRAVCAFFDWAPLAVLKITINNTVRRDDD